jgi:hypothetical protein
MKPILESNQVYGGGRYTNPPDHPAEREEETLYCQYCGEVTKDGEPCPECQIAEAEYLEDR